jgi:hypothetical protein
MMKCIALLFVALALAGCCVSGNGCHAPMPGTPIAWDGLGTAPTENGSGNAYKPRRYSRSDTEIVIGPLNGTPVQSGTKAEIQDRYAQEEARDRAAEVKLTKQLVICRNC